RPVDLIAVFGTPPTEAAKAATTTIPIVMIGVGDAVRTGLVASLARPGGNITGNTVLSPDLGGKRLELLREAIPTVARVAYLTNPDNTATLDVLAEMKPAAAAAGIALTGVEFGQRFRPRRGARRHAAGAHRGACREQRSVPPAARRPDHRFFGEAPDRKHVPVQGERGGRRPHRLRRKPRRAVP